MLRRIHVLFLLVVAGSLVVVAQTSSRKPPTSNPAPPRSDSGEMESSSKDTKIDLSAPPGDAREHPNSGMSDDITELQPYNPLRAIKDLEVGDYYFKRGNLIGAEYRYRDALRFKPNDAEATYKLALTLEKKQELDEAAKYYASYLEILPHGPRAADSKAALERMKKREDKSEASPDPKKK